MKCLLYLCLGLIAGILFAVHLELHVSKIWDEKNQRIEKLENELYETKLEVRKLWKEKNQAWGELARVKGKKSED